MLSGRFPSSRYKPVGSSLDGTFIAQSSRYDAIQLGVFSEPAYTFAATQTVSQNDILYGDYYFS